MSLRREHDRLQPDPVEAVPHVPLKQRFRGTFWLQTGVVILAGLALSWAFGAWTAKSEFENLSRRASSHFARVLSGLVERGDYIGIEENAGVLVAIATLGYVKVTSTSGYQLVERGDPHIEDAMPIRLALEDGAGRTIGHAEFIFDRSSYRYRTFQFLVLCAIVLLTFSLASFLIMSRFMHRMLILPVRRITRTWSQPYHHPMPSSGSWASTELVEMEDALSQTLARARSEVQVDELTRVLNRRAFNDFMNQAGADLDALGLFFVDIDDFKQKNTMFGHFESDRILATVAARLVEIVATDGLVYRIGGDEFVIIAVTVDASRNLRKRLGRRVFVHYANGRIRDVISLSIGFAGMPEDATTVGELKRIANEAMYTSKREGKNRSKA